MRTPRGVASATLLVALAACSTPTLPLPETATPPGQGAAFDGGVGFGSGGFVAPPAAATPGVGFGSGGFTDSTSAASTTTATTCVDRTGVGFGSGGFTDPCLTGPR